MPASVPLMLKINRMTTKKCQKAKIQPVVKTGLKSLAQKLAKNSKALSFPVILKISLEDI
jgi:hypothetical protein